MSGQPTTTRDALMQAMAQRNAQAQQPQAEPDQDEGGAGQMVQAVAMVGQLLMALAQNPQAIQQIMAAAQGGAPQGPPVG